MLISQMSLQQLVFRATVPLRLAVATVLEPRYRGLVLTTGGHAVCGNVGEPYCTGLFHL